MHQSDNHNTIIILLYIIVFYGHATLGMVVLEISYTL